MPKPDYLQFRQSYRNSLIHSPKGTTWKKHKYIRKEEKRYIYKELQNKIHSVARNIRDDIKESEQSLTTLYKESKEPVKEATEPLFDIGNEAIKKVFSKDWFVKNYEISSDITDKGWGLLEKILEKKR